MAFYSIIVNPVFKRYDTFEEAIAVSKVTALHNSDSYMVLEHVATVSPVPAHAVVESHVVREEKTVNNASNLWYPDDSDGWGECNGKMPELDPLKYYAYLYKSERDNKSYTYCKLKPEDFKQKYFSDISDPIVAMREVYSRG